MLKHMKLSTKTRLESRNADFDAHIRSRRQQSVDFMGRNKAAMQQSKPKKHPKQDLTHLQAPCDGASTSSVDSRSLVRQRVAHMRRSDGGDRDLVNLIRRSLASTATTCTSIRDRSST